MAELQQGMSRLINIEDMRATASRLEEISLRWCRDPSPFGEEIANDARNYVELRNLLISAVGPEGAVPKFIEQSRTVGELNALLVSVDPVQAARRSYIRRAFKEFLKSAGTIREKRPTAPQSEVVQMLYTLWKVCNNALYRRSEEDDIHYKELVERLKIEDYVHLPNFILSSPTLLSFSRKARYFDENLGKRADFLSSEFEQTIAGVINEMSGESDDAIISSSWTGVRTVADQVRVVREIVPIALEALSLIIESEERRLHNNPPDPIGVETLDILRSLHTELGQLLRHVEAGNPLDQGLSRVRALASQVLRFGTESINLMLTGLPAMTAAAVPSLALIKAMELLYGGAQISGEAGATIVGGVSAGYMALSSNKKPASSADS